MHYTFNAEIALSALANIRAGGLTADGAGWNQVDFKTCFAHYVALAAGYTFLDGEWDTPAGVMRTSSAARYALSGVTKNDADDAWSDTTSEAEYYNFYLAWDLFDGHLTLEDIATAIARRQEAA